MALPQRRQEAVYGYGAPNGGVSGYGAGVGDYGTANGPRYGVAAPGPVVMSYPVGGHVPAQAMAPYPQVVVAHQPADEAYDTGRAAASLADGMNQMVLGPAQGPSSHSSSPGRGGGYYNQQGGYSSQQAGYTSHPGGYSQQQGGYSNHQGGYSNHQAGYSYYPVQPGHHQGPPGPPLGRGGGRMGMQQHMNGRGRGGPGPHPGGERRQQQRRRKVQKGLEENVRRTVYISYIDQQVTEESLATLFQECGTVMDCRICGDPNSYMRFAFIEFMEEESAQKALGLTGRILGNSPLRVLASRTAIVPVNKELMPRSHQELERCSRTVYVANIDKKVDREDVRRFFEQLCGPVAKIRLLGDFQHSTRIAFIEFMTAEGAMAALNCSGALLGSLPLRVSPSKTPVRGDKEGDREPPPPTSAPAGPGSQPRTSQSSGSAAGEQLAMPGTPTGSSGPNTALTGSGGQAGEADGLQEPPVATEPREEAGQGSLPPEQQLPNN